jgi:diguanylate cyclase (GGDEF)-like protein
MPGRILVVDDERLFREMFRDALAARGYEVRTASSGPEALALVSSDPSDLLVTDLRMPLMDGIQLVEEALRLDPGMEAVAVTAADDLATAVRAMQVGCADFLVKPVEEEHLAQSVARALSRARVRREHARLLDENLEFLRSQSLFHQSLSILGTLDLERLVDLVLQVLSRATDAQGAALWVADERGPLALRGYRGLVDRSALPARIDPREGPLSAHIAAGAPFEAPGASPAQAFLTPLLADQEPLGLVLLAARARGRFGEEEQVAAATLGRFAAIALRNARRVQQLEKVGLRDRETGAYNLAYFVDYAGKEFYKARRYGRAFSLAVLTVDNAEQLRREAGLEPWRAATRGLVAAVSRAVRDADILAKVTESEYHVLLPETDHFGALMFARRAAEEVRREPAVRTLYERCPPQLALGAATFPKDGEDFEELIHQARVRQMEQRGSLVRRLPLADLGPSAFWELFDLLLDARTRIPEGSPSARREADPELFAAVQREAAREVGRDPRARGHLYVGVPAVGSAPVLSALPPAGGGARSGDASARIAVLGGRGGAPEPPAHPLLSAVYVDGDRRLAGSRFVLWLSEHASYALLEDEGGRAFHSADAPLVDALVSRLQALHDLEPL